MDKILEKKPDVRYLLTRKIYGYCLTQAIKSAIYFEIPDLLKRSPLNICQLSKATKCPEASLSRFMLFLMSEDIFVMDEASYFHNNESSLYLTKDHPQTLHDLANMHGSKLWWGMWSKLPDCIISDTSASILNHGINIFEYFDNPSNQQDKNLFDKAMRNIVLADIDDFLKKYDMTKFSSVVDVGGGSGAMISAIKNLYPSLDCYLFEKDNVNTYKDNDFSQKVKYISGNFFTEIISGKDLYIMRHIIHNWDDTSVLQILSNCKKAMKRTSKLCILEYLIGYSNKTNIIQYRDMNMLVAMPLGKERTKESLIVLLETVGFVCERIITLKSDINVMECSLM